MEETKDENPIERNQPTINGPVCVSLMRAALDDLSRIRTIPLPFYNGNYDTQTLAIKLRNNPLFLSENGYNGKYGKYLPFQILPTPHHRLIDCLLICCYNHFKTEFSIAFRDRQYVLSVKNKDTAEIDSIEDQYQDR